ncbi:MarR family transcriptional regulator, partial [Clostridioides difficile]
MQQFYRGVSVLTEKKEVLREIGMIARCLDSISNVEFQHL